MSTDNILYFEDIEVGLTRDCGSITAEKEEMLEFAERFDPQPIHIDEEAARESIFGELIASGWYTASLAARLLVKGYMNDTATRGGRGMDDLRWHWPLHPDDELSVTVEVVNKEPAENIPTIGRVDADVTATNQDGTTVLTMVGLGLVKRREA